MRLTDLPDHIRDLALANPDTRIQLTITVDPVVSDGLLREVDMLPVYRLKESMPHLAEREMRRYLNQSFFGERANASWNSLSTFAEIDEAKRLVALAFITKEPSMRRRLAESALSLYPGCAEAYIILARLEMDSAKKIKLLEQGIEIASAPLDKGKFNDPEDYFWQEIDTRPYMRCRAALAVALWECGKTQIAIENLKSLLKLNPYDNQGLRYHLLNWMLYNDPNDYDLDESCVEYCSDKSALVKYACLLWRIIRFGSEKGTHQALSDAVEANKFVPALLCGRAELSSLAITRVERGTPLEAIAYQRIGAAAWQKAGRALSWLADNCSPSLLSSKTILRKIASAKEFELEGTWAEPVPLMDSLQDFSFK